MQQPVQQPVIGEQRAAYQALVHERAVVVDDNGVATVTVTLTDVTFEEPLVLATMSIPNAQAHFDTSARTESGEVVAVGVATTRQGVKLAAIGPIPGRRCRKLTWTFRVSNRVRFSMRDLLLASSAPGHAVGALEFLTRSHVLRIRSQELQLSLRFQNGFVPRRPRAVQIADKPLWHRVSCDLQVVSDEPIDCEPTSAVRYSWREPLVGRRFVLAYDPPQGNELERAVHEWREASSLLDQILSLRRSIDMRAQELQRVLSTNLAAQLEELFGSGSPSRDPAASSDRRTAPPWTSVGFLWDRREVALRPVYGTFPASHFGRQFALGEGVAGHAFRFGKEATYAGENATLLYRPRANKAEDYGWLVCVPLRFRDTCIGVVSFAGRDDLPTDHIDVELRALAVNPRADTPNPHGGAPATSSLSVLTWRVNCAFWAAVAESPWLSTHDRRTAGECLKSLKLSDGASTRVNTPTPISVPARKPRKAALVSAGVAVPLLVALMQWGPTWIEKIAALPWFSKPTETKVESAVSYDEFVRELRTTHDVEKLKTIRKQWVAAGSAIPSFDGVKLDRLIMRDAPLDHLHMPHATLAAAYLERADLSYSNLEDADLRSAHLDDANLQAAILQGASMQNAQLRGARLCQSRMRDAQLQGTMLDDAFMENADLSGANLTDAHLEYARGLTNEQLHKACSDKPLRLPQGIDQPPSCKGGKAK